MIHNSVLIRALFPEFESFFVTDEQISWNKKVAIKCDGPMVRGHTPDFGHSGYFKANGMRARLKNLSGAESE